MDQVMKRTLLSTVVVVLLLTACAPVPAATEDSAVVEQLNEPSEALTADVPPTEASEQPTITPSMTSSPGASPMPTETPNLTATRWQETVAAGVTEQIRQATQAQWELTIQAGTTLQAQQTQVAQDVATNTPSGTPASIETLRAFLSSGNQTFENCTYTITPQGSKSEEITVLRNPRLALAKGDEIIIIQPVNLRTGPSLANRILMTLRTDPTYIPSITPGPSVTPSPTISTTTPDPNRISYTIIGGPAYSDLSADDASAASELDGTDIIAKYSPYSVSGRKYIWWQIASPDDRRISGWIAEASACGLFYFIQEVPPSNKK